MVTQNKAMNGLFYPEMTNKPKNGQDSEKWGKNFRKRTVCYGSVQNLFHDSMKKYWELKIVITGGLDLFATFGS